MGSAGQMDCKDIYRIAFARDTLPDRWQERFANEPWPETLIAPTGSGKTAGVTLGWVAHRLRAPEATPRRLVWCLPMRALVEQTAETIKQWFERLHERGIAPEMLPAPKDVHILMGGVEAAHWLEGPELPAVIIGTQDMLLSRALMRGYASSRAIWPIEFALLHEDTQWVFDEVQLMGAGRATSTQLEAFRRCEAGRALEQNRPPGRPALSLWVSATLNPNWLETVDFPAPTGHAIRRVEPQQALDARLHQLAAARKTLHRARTMPASHKSADIGTYVKELAREVLEAHCPGRMTLVIVNRVSRAQDLHAALARELKRRPGDAPELALVHGRFRLADRRREMSKLVAQDENEAVRDLIVIATQAVEAGVDISAAVLFTELAPWSSLVQRFGRANRYAELKDGADVRWIDLFGIAGKGDVAGADNGEVDERKTDGTKAAEALSLPYSANELKDARTRLRTLIDAAPVNLPAPDDIEPPRRVIRRKDLDDLFDTDSDLTGFDVDISSYVRDTEDTDVRVFWRDLSTTDDSPPHPHAEELCAVPIGVVKDWLKKVRKKGSVQVYRRDPQWSRRVERTGTTPPGWIRLTEDPWPGLTLLADVTTGGYRTESGFSGDPKHIPHPVNPAQATPSQERKLV